MRTASIVAAGLIVLAGCSSPGGAQHARRPAEDPAPDFRVFPLSLSAIVTLATPPPPPISGGTLVVGRDGVTAVAADPDRDRVYVVDLHTRAVRGTIALSADDEPGRVAEGPGGVFYVALRRGGAVAAIDVAAGVPSLRARIAVCPAPRGMAFAPGDGVLYVACAGGELVSVRASDGVVVRTVSVAPDLRDVVLDGERVVVSRFRRADLLAVAPDGAVAPYAVDNALAGDAGAPPPRAGREPGVAWRTIASPRGGIVMAHQLAEMGPVDDGSGSRREGRVGYSGSGCGPIVAAAVSRFADGAAATTTNSLLGAALPVDVAVARNTDRIVLVAAGNAHVEWAPSLYTLHDAAFEPGADGACGHDNEITTRPDGQPIAAAFDGADSLVVQTREPAALHLIDQGAVIDLGGTRREDTGHTIFHSNSGVGLACASCHPEGGDDGRVWRFVLAGVRRTQNLRGGLLATAPFHWGGELADVSALMTEVFHRRMGGPMLAGAQVDALARWIDAIPTLPRAMASDPAAVARGQALFNDPVVACTSCHSGPQGTNNATVVVGFGPPLQVPRLVGLGSRAPYMHDGCAATLLDRFGPACGGGDAHGHTSQLSAGQIGDLVAYLESL